MKKFRIVLLECPYDNWEYKETRELFAKMVSLKLAGYRREYAYGVLPLDTSDFIATHQFICLETKANQLDPIIAFRSLGLQNTRKFPIPFPPLGLMKNIGAEAHHSAITELIQAHGSPGKDLLYGSSMAVHEKFRGDPKIKEILMAMDVLFQTERGFSSAMTGAVVRFKVDQLFRVIGYVPLKHAGKTLDTVPVPFVHNEPTLFMRLEKFSPVAISCANKYAELWRERIVIGDSLNVDKREAA